MRSLFYRPRLTGGAAAGIFSGHFLAVSLLTAAIAIGAFASSASAQSVRSRTGNSDFPPIGEVVILVYDVNRGSETIAELAPGGTVTINPGQKARLRMQVKPTKNSPKARYPSARFVPARPLSAIQPVKLDEQVGSYTFIGERQENRGGAQAIDYEITDTAYDIPNNLRTGRVFVALAAVDPPPASGPAQPPVTVPGAPPAERRGVTLYVDSGFRGQSERLYSSDPNLRDNRIGNDRLSSIQVDPGCVARLFEASEYRGDYDEVRFDLGDFESIRVRNDHVSSIQVDCSDAARNDRDDRGLFDRGRDGRGRDGQDPNVDDRGFRRGVTLYSDSGFRGALTFFADGSYADLRRTEIGERSASSVAVSTGCVAVLYESANFRGRSFEATGDVDALSRTQLGNDNVSSIRVLCR